MIKTYLKYKSIEEILDTLQVEPFVEYRKQAITRILLSNSSTDYKIDAILEQRTLGKTFEMLVHAIYKAQEEKVLVLTSSYDNCFYIKYTLDFLLKNLDLNVKNNIVIKTVYQSYVGFNFVFMDSTCEPTHEQLNSLKQVNLYYKPVNYFFL
jgi:formyltetrahydrofolate hydrolase